MSKRRDDVERWLIHNGWSFEYKKDPENTFKVVVKHAGPGIPIEIFEPKAQQGVLVIGSKVTMKNNQIARYLTFNKEEKEKFKEKVKKYCNSIEAINKNTIENGKQKIGVYVVLDGDENPNQQMLFDAIDRVLIMHEKTARFLLKTF